MMYPFRFKLGDGVQIIDGHNKDRTGTVTALELSRNKTIAIIVLAKSGAVGATVREHESNVRALA